MNPTYDAYIDRGEMLRKLGRFKEAMADAQNATAIGKSADGLS